MQIIYTYFNSVSIYTNNNDENINTFLLKRSIQSVMVRVTKYKSSGDVFLYSLMQANIEIYRLKLLCEVLLRKMRL
jgi:hypothetical protein